MGRKIHPIGFRLKVNRDWDARWYAEDTARGERQRYKDLLLEDFAIRRFIKYTNEESRRAGISRVEIERFPNQIVITIHTARPGILIGRKGDSVKKLRTSLENMTKKKIKVEVSEIDKPDMDSTLVAENIAGQLERRIGHSRAIKRAISQAMRQGAQGIKIEVTGRLAGADMARREWQAEGRIPRSTLRANIDYGTAEALTTFGRIGIKVWIYKGEILGEEETKSEPRDVFTMP